TRTAECCVVRPQLPPPSDVSKTLSRGLQTDVMHGMRCPSGRAAPRLTGVNAFPVPDRSQLNEHGSSRIRLTDGFNAVLTLRFIDWVRLPGRQSGIPTYACATSLGSLGHSPRPVDRNGVTGPRRRGF